MKIYAQKFCSNNKSSEITFHISIIIIIITTYYELNKGTNYFIRSLK